jgi:two-component system sensor kinase FixL
MANEASRDDENQVLAILKHALENTNEAFVTIDEDHRVLFFNKAAERIFGYSQQEVIGHDLDVIMSPSCSRNHSAAVSRYVKTRIPGRIGHESEIQATRRNGNTFPASISFSVTEVKGKLFFTGIVRDITETRALREQIMRSERLAALGQLVAEITHEIKNPLMMIGGFARQLIPAIDDEKSLQKLNIITDEVKRLEILLADLREFYLPKTITTEPVNIKKLLREVRSLVKEDCKKKNIRTELDIDNKAVFLNLVKNSIEAMDNGGNLSIRTRLSGDQVEITVADDGSGISEQDREKIFSPFFTTKRYGTGLGLCISKRIIEEHGGSSLSVESEEGKGTTFKMSLPVAYQALEDLNKDQVGREAQGRT